MSGSFDSFGRLTIADGRIVAAVGKKKSGKSLLLMSLLRTYPGDRLVIDVAQDDGPEGPGVITFAGDMNELPGQWPESLRDGRQPMTIRYRPDPGSRTFREDMDAAVGIAMAHGRCALLVHEMGVLAPANSVLPHTRRLLMHNRHNRVTAFLAMPRAVAVDPLVLAQSDVVYAFKLQQPSDRKRLADNVGVPQSDVDKVMTGLSPFEYLRYDSNREPGQQLTVFPPLPKATVQATEVWSRGRRSADDSVVR